MLLGARRVALRAFIDVLGPFSCRNWALWGCFSAQFIATSNLKRQFVSQKTHFARSALALGPPYSGVANLFSVSDSAGQGGPVLDCQSASDWPHGRLDMCRDVSTCPIVSRIVTTSYIYEVGSVSFAVRRRPEGPSGSSPRVWGGCLDRDQLDPRVRFIPTGVGRFQASRSSSKAPPVHPHGCGAVSGTLLRCPCRTLSTVIAYS